MRVPEPSQLMVDVDQCVAYNESLDNTFDLCEYVDLYKHTLGITSGTVIDLGSGSCNFVIALCQAFPDLTFVCYENSDAMIKIAHENIQRANLSNRITIIKDDLMNAKGSYDAVLLNRVLHHIDNTQALWQVISKLSSNVLAVDLKRHNNPDDLTKFVNKISDFFHPIYVEDTKNSFMAAYSYSEVLEQVKEYGYNVKSIDSMLDDIPYGKLVIYHTK